jgi:hypothetical protein
LRADASRFASSDEISFAALRFRARGHPRSVWNGFLAAISGAQRLPYTNALVRHRRHVGLQWRQTVAADTRGTQDNAVEKQLKDPDSVLHA